ncbi:MAG: FG-GAP-like repeat-containing protein, partial [Cyclobacteriaceae bacterium]|nr:FG-GAP-like repeat-containing protein [Cyclobacteriaceae bacterium]
IFSWDDATDKETPSEGLTYNLYVYSGTKSILIPASDLTTGKLKTMDFGFVSDTTYKIINLPDETYQWGVQTVDQGYNSSQFVSGGILVIGTGVPSPPQIDHMNVYLGPNNTEVHINGSGFVGKNEVTEVYFGTQKAEVLKLQNSYITCKVPEFISGTVDVTVRTGTRTSNAVPFTINGELAWTNHTSSISSAGLNDIDFVGPNTAMAVGIGGKVIKSTDNGVTWTNVPSFTAQDLNFVEAYDKDTIYIGGNNGTLFKSTDSGASWNTVNLGVIDNLNDMEVTVHETNKFYIAANNGKFFRSYDHGLNWETINKPGQDFTCVSSYYGEAYLGTSIGNIYMDKGGLVSVRQITNSTIVDIIKVHTDAYVVTGSSDSYFFGSSNGDVWEEIQLGMPGTTLHGVGLFDQTGEAYAVGSSGKIVSLQGVGFTEQLSQTTVTLNKVVFNEFVGLATSFSPDNGVTVMSPKVPDEPLVNGVKYIDKTLPLDTLLVGGTNLLGTTHFNVHTESETKSVFDVTETSFKAYITPIPEGRYGCDLSKDSLYYYQRFFSLEITGIYELDHPINAADFAWGDSDNDGQMDVLFTDNNKVFINKARGEISEKTEALGTNDGWCCNGPFYKLEWLNLDNKGDFELFLVGHNGNNDRENRTYKKVTNSQYALSSLGSPWSASFGIGLGDYDRDGDEDIIGSTSPPDNGMRLFKNGVNGYEEFCCTWNDIYNGDVEFVDFDKDGDLDFNVTGRLTWDNHRRATTLYKFNGNQPDGLPSLEDINLSIVPVDNSALDWGDMDNDGYPDLLITGQTDSVPVSMIYRNNAGTSLEVVPTTMIGVRNGRAKWGDIDNDGYLDALISGVDANGNGVVKVYINESGASFHDGYITGFPTFSNPRAEWADYDNDGY